MTQQQLEKYLWGAATYLRGHIDAGDYKQYIFPLMFFKRICDVYDEEFRQALEDSDGDLEYAAFEENHRFQIPSGAHWNDVRAVTVNVGVALQEAMRAIEKANPETLYGIFGDAGWTNKERLSDETLINLMEHFSRHKLDIASVPDDQLGDAYEYLIKQFADDSGHTAAEFYTNRTVVRLMTLIMDPQPGETVYDPTCGSGGLLLNCALQLKEAGREYRTLKLYGQEINLITSAIARMNMFLHGIEEFQIVRGNTLSEPAFLENDELKTFNVILANPPYSLKAWDRKAFENDPWGRNIWGTPPQGTADYAFQQHIQKSLDPQNGRSITLWPHGILFREAEAAMRRKMVESDVVECVIGLGPNLFYNSPMEACLLITNNNKPKKRKGKILFINALKEVRQDKSIAFLEDQHINKIHQAFLEFTGQEGFCRVVDINEIIEHGASLNIPLYLSNAQNNRSDKNFGRLLQEWEQSSRELKTSMNHLFEILEKKLRMEESTDKARLKDIDKTNWQTFRLDEIAFNINERIEPTKTDLEIYVGLEHLDPESIHIKRFGKREDVKGTKLRVYPGDIIFGRRRAYQRKAAIADFDGFCSAHALVLRANPEVIDPKLFPFFLHSDTFMNRAVDISVGSLSPTINWGTLKKQEFLLPPKEQQARLAELLWAADTLISIQENIKQKIVLLIDSYLKTSFKKGALLDQESIDSEYGLIPFNWSIKKLGELGEFKNGINKNKSEFGTGFPFVNILDIFGKKELHKKEFDLVKVSKGEIENYDVKKGDILFVRSSVKPEGVGLTTLVQEDLHNTVFSGFIIRFREKSGFLVHDFKKYCFFEKRFRNNLLKRSTISANTNINQESLNKLFLPIPPIKEQRIIVNKLSSYEKTLENVDNSIMNLKKLMFSLINQTF